MLEDKEGHKAVPGMSPGGATLQGGCPGLEVYAR